MCVFCDALRAANGGKIELRVNFTTPYNTLVIDWVPKLWILVLNLQLRNCIQILSTFFGISSGARHCKTLYKKNSWICLKGKIWWKVLFSLKHKTFFDWLWMNVYPKSNFVYLIRHYLQHHPLLVLENFMMIDCCSKMNFDGYVSK